MIIKPKQKRLLLFVRKIIQVSVICFCIRLITEVVLHFNKSKGNKSTVAVPCPFPYFKRSSIIIICGKVFLDLSIAENF